MKLATVNPQLDFSNLSTLLHKDVSLNLSHFWCSGSTKQSPPNMLFPRLNSDVPSMWPFSEFGVSIGKCRCSFSILRPSRSFPVLWFGCYGGSVLPKSVRHGFTPHNQPTICFSEAGECCLRNQQLWLLAIKMNLIIMPLSLVLFSSKGTSGRMAYRTLCL